MGNPYEWKIMETLPIATQVIKLDSFYEVNLEKILTDENIDEFRYFYYFFRREAFITAYF